MAYSKIDSVDRNYWADVYHNDNDDNLRAAYNVFDRNSGRTLGNWLGTQDGVLYTWQDIYNSCMKKFNVELDIIGIKKNRIINGLGSWVNIP